MTNVWSTGRMVQVAVRSDTGHWGMSEDGWGEGALGG